MSSSQQKIIQRNRKVWPIHRKRKQIDKTITEGAETLNLVDKRLNCLKYAQRAEGYHKQRTKGNQDTGV